MMILRSKWHWTSINDTIHMALPRITFNINWVLIHLDGEYAQRSKRTGASRPTSALDMKGTYETSLLFMIKGRYSRVQNFKIKTFSMI